ncbi:MAG: hypothetical protein Q4G63_09505 [Bacteroidia bacterium]|nr:hypothetical protein [Bacteroidia bacterium]
MKKYFIVLIFSLISFPILSQDFNGNYKDKTDSLSFSNGKVIFNVSGFGALFTQMVGEGEYEYFDDYLLINASDYSGKKSIFESIDSSKKDTIVVKIVDSENYSIQGALTEFLSESDKVIRGNITNNQGKSIQAKDHKIKKIKVSNLGYDDIVFNVVQGKNFLVKLAKNNVIENQTVAFKVKHEDEETISIILLSDNFNPGKDRIKSLEKLYKKAQKGNVLSKRLKKEYIPIYRR